MLLSNVFKVFTNSFEGESPPFRRKISDIYETKLYTRYVRNEFGHMERMQVPLRYKRTVQTLPFGKKLLQILVDIVLVPGLLSVFFALFFIFTSTTLIILILLPVSLVLYRYGMESSFQRTLGMYLTGSILVDRYGEKPAREVLWVRAIIVFALRGGIPIDAHAGTLNWLDVRTHTYVISLEELRTLRDLMKDDSNFEA
jgi:hypothetical protein